MTLGKFSQLKCILSLRGITRYFSHIAIVFIQLYNGAHTRTEFSHVYFSHIESIKVHKITIHC